MTTHENILIGSDTSVSLAAILKSLHTMNQYSFITATRVSDIVQLSKSIQPILLILSFRDNQNVINSLLSYHKNFTIPMVCLHTTNQYRELQVRENIVVFTQSYEYGIQSNNLITNILGILKLIKKTQAVSLETTKTQLMSIVNTIKMTRSDRKHWDDFKHYFENINPNFIKTLSTKYPCLTAKDLKYCCYLKMNMSNEDIRLILGINQESVRTHKYRLKKKLVLEKHQDLRNYLQTFSN